ncbi:AfsR/SARP family transcriptional regulator [Nonomuraea diastatica]|nr:BTAD domain-containing putative transcriptional regulator [Nonomuraea diastatica]
MEFRILGPLEASCLGRPIKLGGPRPRSLLAALLLDAGRIVPLDRLVTAIWGDRLPGSARNQVAIHVHTLRKAVKAAGRDAELIVTEQVGYRLLTDGVWLDAHEARQQAAAARRASRPEEASAALARALDLWRGPVLAEIDSTEIAAAARGLENARLDIAEEWADAELACGRPREAVARLAGLVEEHPLREGLRERLMLALWRSGRQADALENYRQGRRHLLDELGLEPGQALRDLQQAILAGPSPAGTAHVDKPAPPPSTSTAPSATSPGTFTTPSGPPGLAVAPPGTSAAPFGRSTAQPSTSAAQPGTPTTQPRTPATPPGMTATQPGTSTAQPGTSGGQADQPPLAVTVRPAQLPPAVSAFVGRTPLIRMLDRLTRPDRDGLPVAVISGAAGVGKTSLALRWAHEVASRFPDGQLFTNLHGYDRDRRSAEPSAVLERLLRALGVPGKAVPPALEERTALFRSTLDGKQVLVLLDNAESAAQVRPLLPGTPGCCVIVTSRRRLEGLTVSHGALQVPLDVLTEQESVELLERVVGAERVSAEQEAATRLAKLCDRSPLPLRIAAAKLTVRPQWSLAEMAERLADEHDRLDQLSRGDFEVRASIELSCRELSERAALAFRWLAMVETPCGFAPWLAAALLDTSVEDAEQLLEQLVDAQLLQPLGSDGAGQPRYRFHDLIRLFAREQAEDGGPPGAARAALRRAFSGLLGLAERARDLRFGHRYSRVPRGDEPRWLPDEAALAVVLSDPLAWLESERLTLVAAVSQCAELGLADLSRDLVASYVHLFESRAYFADWHAVAAKAFDACRAASHLPGQAAMLYSIGALNLALRRLPQATEFLCAALGLFEQLADVPSQAIVLRHLGTVHLTQGDLCRGKAEIERALELFEQVGDAMALAHGLGFLSHVHMLEGRLEEAARLLDRALAISTRRALGEAQLLKRRAEVRRRQGLHAEAVRDGEQALAMTIDLNDLVGQAYALHALGEARLGCGELVAAAADLHQALRIARQVGDRLIEGRILLALGHLEDEESIGCLRQAADIFAGIGSTGWHEQAVKAALAITARAQNPPQPPEPGTRHNRLEPRTRRNRPSPEPAITA